MALLEKSAPKFAPTLSRLLSENRRQNYRRQLCDVLSERRLRVGLRNPRHRRRRRTQASSKNLEDRHRRRRDVIVGARHARLRQEARPHLVQLDDHPTEAGEATAADAVADLPPVVPRSLKAQQRFIQRMRAMFYNLNRLNSK